MVGEREFFLRSKHACAMPIAGIWRNTNAVAKNTSDMSPANANGKENTCRRERECVWEKRENVWEIFVHGREKEGKSREKERETSVELARFSRRIGVGF